MTELALQPNGIWKADLKSRVVRSVYYDGESRLLAIELRHGKIRLYSNAAEEAVLQLVNHHAPGLIYETATEGAFGMPLSRFCPKGATFLRRVKSAKALR
ncbi:KTSC domain-containing protein [Rhizobium sp. BK376]|uniref:KTSC domain-containing protein n=1 Tax=Rhizobium sp. BK376 TaxID=2512149 RepID=UPI001052862F|nr:KTSC domain-containing protein [Rhizobium sp. BK376]TCR63203.1 KTSC domain-containing protein [Rhizobium sp. BK376]